MSENAPAAEGVSAGTLLRQAREAAGLHVATLAANLKVPVRKLEALEEDRYEELPDAVFVRALASSVCRTLKIDAAPVLERLPQMRRPQFAQDPEGINAPFRAPSDGPPPGLLHQVSRPVVLTVAALLVAALVVFFLPMVQSGLETVLEANRSEPATGAPASPAPAAPTELAPAAVPGGPGLPAAPAAAPAAAPTAPAAVTQAPEAAVTPASAPGMQLRTSAGTLAGQASAPASSPAAPASAVADAKGIVVFRARAESWVQVRDARGTTVMQKLMAPGETAGASGALPLSVVVGSAQSTEVQVRGRPLDLAPLTRGDNVARFEVK